MKVTARRGVIAGLLLLTLLLSLWLELQPEPGAELVGLVPARAEPAAAPTDPVARTAAGRAPEAARRSAWPEPSATALAAWSGPPPSAMPAAPQPGPPQPKAQPFPYQWIGQLDDGDTVQALLSGPQRSFGVRAGEVLDGRWRVERLGIRGLQVTWLPTGDQVDVTAR